MEELVRRLVGPPDRSVVLHDGWFARFAELVAALDAGTGVRHDPESLLVERALLLGHRGWGTTAPGGSCRLLPARDGWLAVNLARLDDLDLVPAWLGVAPPPDGRVWEVVAAALATSHRRPVLAAAIELGLPVAEVPGQGERISDTRPGVLVRPGGRRRRPHAARVVDLSSLWAGPLCGALLAEAGHEVLKVESTRRPDGGRAGAPAFYRRLNHAKRVVDLDLATAAGRDRLAELVADADVVIEASRPRALRQLGIDAEEQVAQGTVWVSITGYGRREPAGARVAFGDDAAAAGGLVTWVDDPDPRPWFIGDAAADPVTGVTAAVAALEVLDSAAGAMVDVSMRDAVADLTQGRPVPGSIRPVE